MKKADKMFQELARGAQHGYSVIHVDDREQIPFEMWRPLLYLGPNATPTSEMLALEERARDLMHAAYKKRHKVPYYNGPYDTDFEKVHCRGFSLYLFSSPKIQVDESWLVENIELFKHYSEWDADKAKMSRPKNILHELIEYRQFGNDTVKAIAEHMSPVKRFMIAGQESLDWEYIDQHISWFRWQDVDTKYRLENRKNMPEWFLEKHHDKMYLPAVWQNTDVSGHFLFKHMDTWINLNELVEHNQTWRNQAVIFLREKLRKTAH